jgi:error-prone DNA polymerase
MSYVELHCASAFSFLEAASLPETLIDRAADLGYPALALLDRDGVFGAPRFHKAATAAGIRPIVGAELTMMGTTAGARGQGPGAGRSQERGARAQRDTRDPLTPSLWPLAPDTYRLPVLVESAEGYRNLCQLVTLMKLRAPKGEGALALEELAGRTAGLVALVGREALVGRRFGVGGLVDRLVGLFGRSNVYVELQRHLLRDEEADTQVLLDLAAAFHVPVVATNGVRFRGPDERPLFDVLTCIRHRTDLGRAGRRLSQNAERYLKPPEEMARLFSDQPAAVATSVELAGRLQYTLADLGYRFPAYPVPPGETMSTFLRKVTEVGARERYRPYHERARAQIARELDLIEKLDLAGYFLIVWDIVNFCRQQRILAQGRGSAANSAVCYSLGITAVDPVGMELLFERFLSEERGEWPDIDLDLPSGDRRERVIQHVYEKYGPHGAAMTANVITYRGRSAAREVGKALGLEAGQIDRLAKVMNHFEFRDPGETLGRHLAEIGLDADQPRIQLFADLWQRIQDLPRHLGQHSGGMVICQGQLDAVVPLENASMPGRVVVQWDKDDCADMGIVKIDLLGLGMMAVIQDALETINTVSSAATSHVAPGSLALPALPIGRLDDGVPGPPLDLWNIPPDDPEVYRMLQAADTVGVFQVESRAQMATLPRLRPERFYDLVVEVALIRPGPVVGQMVHPYLNRRAGREPVTYPHPALEPILKRTLGVPLFQEQILRIAMVAAGFSGGQAEELRRAFSFKRSERRMQQVEVRLWEGMAKQGITGEAAEQIVKSITSFALYGFPESHSASFALLVYASAYLRAHFPAAFAAAILNNQPMGFYRPATIVKDAQRHGVRFAPIDVERSDWPCTVEEDGAVRLGLCYVAGLRREVGLALARARSRDQGPVASGQCETRDPLTTDHRPLTTERRRFHGLEDMITRTGVNREELATLAEIGALNCFGYNRREALWQIEKAIRPAGELFTDRGQEPEARGQEPEARDQEPGARDQEPGAMDQRDTRDSLAPGPWSPGPDECPLPPMSPLDRLVTDYEGTGLTIGPHPMAMRRQELALRGVLRAADLPGQRHGRRVRVAGAVITRQRPGTAKGFVFLTLEDETGIANIIIRPDVFAGKRLTIIEEPFLLIEGTLQNLDGVTSVRAERLEGIDGTPVEIDARNFY